MIIRTTLYTLLGANNARKAKAYFICHTESYMFIWSGIHDGCNIIYYHKTWFFYLKCDVYMVGDFVDYGCILIWTGFA